MAFDNSSSNKEHPEVPTTTIALKSCVSSVAIPVVKTPEYVERLRALVHSTEDLVAAGSITGELSDEALDLKKRCSGCGKRMLCYSSGVLFFNERGLLDENARSAKFRDSRIILRQYCQPKREADLA